MFINSILAGVVLDWSFINNLIDNDDGKIRKEIKKKSKELKNVLYQRNKHWRRQKLVQKYITRLKYHVRCGLYGNISWTEVYNKPYTQCWKTTGTPCSCYLCKRERYNRNIFKRQTKLEVDMI